MLFRHYILTTTLENRLKSFLVRLLQVLWVIGFAVVLGGIFANIAFYNELPAAVFGACAWLIFFAVIQYLLFATLDPRALFDGSIVPNNKGGITRRSFAIGIATSLALVVISGVITKLYLTYQDNQKLEAGSDIDFYSEILTESTYRHDFTDCYYTEEDKPKKADVQQIARNLENKGVVGLNILVEIADRNDKIGEAFRCAIREDMSIDEMATIAGIDY